METNSIQRGTPSEEERQAVRALAALAQDLRLRVFRALVKAGPDGLTPTMLLAATGVAGATLSFHLKELTAAQLVAQRREGRNLFYRVRFEQMTTLLNYLTEHCCSGAPCGLADRGTASPDPCCASDSRTSTPSLPLQT